MTEFSQPAEQTASFEPRTIEEVLHPSHTALLVVDMQNDFLDDNGFFSKNPDIVGGDYRQMMNAMKPIQEMIVSAREAGVKIIFTKGYEDMDFRSGPDLFRAIGWGELEGAIGINSESGKWGSELYEGIEPQEDDIIIEKHKWTVFSGREARHGERYDPNDTSRRTFREVLDQEGIRTLVTTGVIAETCIETTIRDAYGEGFFVVVPQNSVGSNNQDQLEARMNYWKKGFVANVLKEEEIGTIWASATPQNASPEA